MGVKICGQVGRLKREKIEEYVELHANTWEGVLKTIKKCHLNNYSIFLHDDMVFAYFEYTGSDFDADMVKMAKDQVTQNWWALTRPCFVKFAISEQDEFYTDMKQIFYNE